LLETVLTVYGFLLALEVIEGVSGAGLETVETVL
jgi:hypothetical protein